MPTSIRFRHLIRAALCLQLSVFCWLPVHACLDIDFDASLSESPKINSQSVQPGEAYFAKDKAYYQEKAAHFKAEWDEHGVWRDRVSYAVCLALLGEYDKALTHLKAVEEDKPGQYNVAINLATVYERKKQYKLALQWMEKAIAIDPEAHFGSEWIHLNILKAEVAGKQNRCTAQQLIEQDFGADSMPQTTLKEAELERLASSVFYQLNQRVWLYPNADPIAARLAFELGNLNFLRRFPTVCLLDYELAKEKGFADRLLQKRMAAVEAGTYKAPPPSAEQIYVEKVVDQMAEESERALKKVEEAEAEDQALVEQARKTNRLKGTIAMITLFLVLAGGLGVVFWFLYKPKSRQNNLRKDDFDDLFNGKDA
jgi:Tetratricopeptide repeat